VVCRLREAGDFLDDVAAHHPKAIRYLLSNACGRGMLELAGATAHQHLARPLRAAEVFARLHRTLGLGNILADPALKALVSRLKAVPSPPPVYMAIMNELRDDEASPHKVGDLVARDAGMSAKILAGSLPDDYGVVIDQADADHVATWIVERQMLEATHADVGAYLLGLWGLPDPIVEAVAWHHRPSGCGAPAASSLTAVHAADVIEHRLHPADTAGGTTETDGEFLDRLELTATFPAWAAACRESDPAAMGA
jgi:hypothetical protein